MLCLFLFRGLRCGLRDLAHAASLAVGIAACRAKRTPTARAAIFFHASGELHGAAALAHSARELQLLRCLMSER